MYYQAETAVVVGAVELSENVSIWHQAVVRADEAGISIGAGTNIQDGAVLHVDEHLPMVIGKGCTVGHRAILHSCRIEDDVLVGMGAIVLNGAKIGAGSIIGAGAVILENAEIPSRSLVVGVPGKVRGTVSDAQFAGIIENGEKYIVLAKTVLIKK